MQFAYNENGHKILPYKNGKATCNICGGKLIAHCGEILVDHWQHYGERQDCDTWKEHETLWHRTWKEKFPKEWREVVIENHRADVKTSDGLVLEFQNSPISPAMIRTREEFYGNMFWVVNAADFDENLEFKSLVKANLCRHDEHIRYDAREAIRKIEMDIGQAESARIEANRGLSDVQRKINSKKSEIEKLEGHCRESNKIAQRVAHYKPANLELSHWNYPTAQIWETIDKRLLIEVTEQLQTKDHLENEIKRLQKPLQTIYQYPDYELSGVVYKQVGYKDLSVQNYHKFKPVVKATMNQLFPDIRPFLSESDFLSYKYIQDTFVFIIDLNQKAKELEATLMGLQKEFESVSNRIEDSFEQLSKATIAWLETQKGFRNQELAKLEEELEEAKNVYQICKAREERLIKEKPYQIGTILAEIEYQSERGKSKIMQTFKGTYTLNWKYERKSWQAAEAPLYFDTGKGHLLGRSSSKSGFKKISIAEFVSDILDAAEWFKK